MQQTLKFNIALPLYKKVRHIKEKSFYNHNYYQLENYGDWVDFGEDDNRILYEVYDECSNCYTYCFGHFNKDGKFVRAFGYSSDESIFNDVDIDYGQ
jgi:hypothetical protein